MNTSKKLKVVIFAQYFPPDLGGSATRAYNVAKGLALNECDVTVVTAFPHYPHGDIPQEYRWKPVVIEWVDNLKVIRTFILPLKSEGLFKRLLLLTSFALSALFAVPFYWSSDVIWSSSWVPGVLYGKFRKKKIVLNVDDITLIDLISLKLIDEESIVLKIGKVIYGFFYKQCDLITPISPGYIDIISNEYRINKDRIKVILGGVDLSLFFPKTLKKINPNKFTVLYIGAFSVAYDFNQIINAAKLLTVDTPEIQFIIQGDGEEYCNIKDAIERSNVNNILLIKKIVSREKVVDVLNSADALILPLKNFNNPYSGISTKLYEYQAVGKPIICIADGTSANYISLTNSGISIKPEKPESLANAIKFFYNNPNILEKFSLNGYNYVKNNVSLEQIGNQLKCLLLSVIND